MTPITINGNINSHIIGENISYIDRVDYTDPFGTQYKIVIGFGEMTSKVLIYNSSEERDTIYEGIVAQLGTVVDISP